MRLLICEQSTLFREGIKAVLLTHPSIEVVGTASNGKQAFERVLSLRPDVVLMDIAMSYLGGFSGVDFITRTDKDIRILVFTALEEEEMLAQCLNSGASGYIRKDATGEQLVEAIQTVYEGGTYFRPRPMQFPEDPVYHEAREISSFANSLQVNGSTIVSKPREQALPGNLIEFPSSN